LLAAAAVLALGVAAVTIRAAARAALRDSGLSAGAASGLALLFMAAALFAARRYSAYARTTSAPSVAAERLQQATVAILFASAVLVPSALALLRRPGAGGAARPATPDRPVRITETPRPPVPSAGAQPASGRRFSIDINALLWVLLGAAGFALLIVLAVTAVRLLRATPATDPVRGAPTGSTRVEDEALAEALRAGRFALDGDDARTAIIACYAAMEESLGSAGVVRKLADSPTDLLRRAMQRGLPDTGRGAAVLLTELFREARYSTHAMTHEQLAEAVRALDSVTEALAERIRAHEADAERPSAAEANAQ
jgi:hypothetical protein